MSIATPASGPRSGPDRGPSRALLRACASVGFCCPPNAHQADRSRERRARAAALRLADRLPRAGIAAITGPSGSGKTTTLIALASMLAGRRERVVLLPRASAISGQPAIDLLRGPVRRRLRTLGAFGLAESALLPLNAETLSAGQRSRLRLALTLDQLGTDSCWLLVDEFCSSLDDQNAISVALTVSRWAERHRHLGHRLVFAGSSVAMTHLRAAVRADCRLDASVLVRVFPHRRGRP